MAKRENNIRFTSLDEVNDFAVKEEKVLVVLSDTVLDVTTFSHYHPGGAGLISNYSGKNIEE